MPTVVKLVAKELRAIAAADDEVDFESLGKDLAAAISATTASLVVNDATYARLDSLSKQITKLDKLAAAGKIKPFFIAAVIADMKKGLPKKAAIKVKDANLSAIVNLQLKSAQNRFKDCKKWVNYEIRDTLEMVSMVFSDGVDHFKIALMLAKDEDPIKIFNFANSFDSSSRDLIPSKVWRYISVD